MLKVLTTGRLATAFAAAVEASELRVQIRCIDHPQQSDIDWADCLACFPISADLSLKHVPWIHSFGAGVDGFLGRSDLCPTLRLSRTTGHLGQKMGEFCLCHLLNFLQSTAAIALDKHTKTWRQRPVKGLGDQTVLMLGTGQMARGVAQILAPLGVNIVGVNNTGSVSDEHFQRCVTMAQVPQVAHEVGGIINTLPLHRHSERLVDLPWLSNFREALLINVGRAATIKTEDLQMAFQEHYLAFAVLDVFDHEPLAQDSWLWQHPQVFVSPHQAAITDVRDVMKSFTAALHAYERGLHSDIFVDLRRGY